MMEARIMNVKTQTARRMPVPDRERHAQTFIFAPAAQAVLTQVSKRTHAPPTICDSSDAMPSGDPLCLPVRNTSI
ncbi:hypothetical protein WL00_28290 [Burkholderia cepacia]|nr:hypothetical protein WK70_05150 [Burkholderia cepacia]KVW83098.1 hypothetical protein WL00_28290 [Burkholderia cepacia]MCR5896516.1 hypothetical protein [Burkholderia sp. HAN2018]OUE45938.1 hypothetical protein BZY94_10555 [Burkholderia territorii]